MSASLQLHEVTVVACQGLPKQSMVLQKKWNTVHIFVQWSGDTAVCSELYIFNGWCLCSGKEFYCLFTGDRAPFWGSFLHKSTGTFYLFLSLSPWCLSLDLMQVQTWQWHTMHYSAIIVEYQYVFLWCLFSNSVASNEPLLWRFVE